MKNHLSIELSIFSGGRSWLGGRGGSWSGETRLGEWATVRLVLILHVSPRDLQIPKNKRGCGKVTYVEIPPGWVLPVMSFSHASAHSRTTSMAYL